MKVGIVNNNYSNSNYQLRNRHKVAFGDSLGIIKPEAKHLEEFIFSKIKKANFTVLKKEETVLSKEVIEKHYAGLKKAADEKLAEGKDFLIKIYNQVIENMQKGSVTKFVIKGDEAEVARFKEFVGATQYQKRDPKSLRGMVESLEVKRLKEKGIPEEKIEEFRDEFTFIHASDIDFFDSEKLVKNYDREIALHFPQ